VDENVAASEAEVLDFRPHADMRWEITRVDDALEMRNTFGARAGGPPVHVHEAAEERFTILEGKLELCIDGAWRVLGPGDEAVIAPGVPHTLRGHPETSATVVNVHRPALRYAELFRDFHRLVQSGALKLPPKDPRSLLVFGVLLTTYPDLQRTVTPPQALVDLLGRMGRAAGVRVRGGRPGRPLTHPRH
jgi:quercetin dioxygenase-like cupin family protein